jgi:cellulose synthase/poly-beta-1,6-N-acetylglucosamine synthase-like glycosyltransferase
MISLGKIRFVLYSLIIIVIFVLIHLLFTFTPLVSWSTWIQKTNQLFTGGHLKFLGLFILGAFLFVVFVILYGTAFLASFGKADYPKGSEGFLPAISVLMPAINEEDIIPDTLNSFVATSYPKEKLELVIIASGSTDRTAEICRGFKDRLNIQVLTDPLEKKGKPAALNYGLKHASNEIIVVYDADTQLQEITLQALVRHLYNPAIVATSGPVIVRNWNDNKLTKGIALEYTYVSGTGLYHEIRNRLGRNLWVMGRNYAIRKKVIEEVGGWNEDALTEDLHLSSQLSARKLKIKYAPGAKINERVPNNYAAFKKQRRRWLGGFNQSLSAAMELDKRSVILRNFGMMHYGHIADFSVGAIIAAILFGLFGELFIMTVCLSIFIFTFGMIVVAIRKYGERKYRLLLYYFVYIFIDLYMFTHQFRSIEEMEWEKTDLS